MKFIFFIFIVFSIAESDCITLTSNCLPQTRQIQRLGAFRDNGVLPTQFVFTITQYGESNCITPQFTLKFSESISCIKFASNAYGYQCTKRIDSISVSIASIEEMQKYGYICNKGDEGVLVDISKTSCTVSNSSGFSSVARALYTTGTYKLAMNENNTFVIDSVAFYPESNELCYKSHVKEILIGIGITLCVIIVIVIIAIRIYICEQKHKASLQSKKTINLGDDKKSPSDADDGNASP